MTKKKGKALARLAPAMEKSEKTAKLFLEVFPRIKFVLNAADLAKCRIKFVRNAKARARKPD